MLATTAGIQTLSFTIPQDTGANVVTGATFARFRLSTAGGLSPTGEASDGEVEDYPVTIAAASSSASITPTPGAGPTTARLVGGNQVVSQGGVTLYQVPVAESGPLTITGSDPADDMLVIDYSADFIPVNVTFHGGSGAGGNDSLIVTGGSFATVTHTFTSAGPEHSGSIVYLTSTPATATISYDGLEPVDMTGSTITNLIFNLPGTNDQAVLEDDPGTVANVSQIRSVTGMFETTLFTTPTGSLTVNLGGDAATFAINSLDAAFNAPLTINGEAGSDSVNFGAAGPINIASNLTLNVESVTNSTAASLTVTGTATFGSGTVVTLGNQAGDSINFGAITLNGAGAISITEDSSTTFTGTNTAASLTLTSTGDITVNGATTITNAISLTAQQAIAINANVSSTASGTISLLANQDDAGSEGFTMALGTAIATGNDTPTAVTIGANQLAGVGTGTITLQTVTAGTTSGPTGGRVTIDANMGAVVDGNAATNNITAGNAVLRGLAGVGTLADPIETTVSRLEGAGGTGGFFVRNAGSLSIGGIGGTVGLTTSTGAIDVRTTAGSLTVEENVSSTSGNISLQATDSAATVNELTVNSGVTILSTLGNISLAAGDNLTLTSGSIINATLGSIAITGDAGDADIGTGTTVTIAAQLIAGSLTGTTITGGSDNDNYAITYPTGATNIGTVTLSDAAGTDAVVVSGTSGSDSIFFTSGAPTTATTEQVGRGGVSTEPIVLPTSIESLRLNGGDGNDTFTVQPSLAMSVIVDGGNPVFGNPGVPPGDTVTLDTLGNTFTVSGQTIFMNGGSPTAFKGITAVNIESLLPTPASATAIQRYDFNALVLNGTRTAFVQTPTQPGYIGVTPSTLYSPLSGYGWNVPLVGVFGGSNSAADAALVNDGHLFSTGTASDLPKFTANVANGWVQATVTFGHPGLAMDGLAIRNADASQYDYLAQNLSTGEGQSCHATVYVLVTDGTLDLRFEDFLNSRMIVISSIDIRPAVLFSIGFSDAPSGVLSADGSTVDTFTIAVGPANSLVTVSPSLGTIVGTDADPKMDGFQVATNGAGTGTIQIRRPSGAGQSLISLSTATGENSGCVAIDYAVVNTQFFDFNTNVSATQVGYHPVITTDLYSAAEGHGWLSQPDNYSTVPAPAGTQTNLLSDGHRGGAAGTFRVDLDNGSYEVHVYMGDAADHVGVSLAANGTTVVNSVPLPRNTITERTFPVTVTGGQLSLTFSSNDRFFNDPHWCVNGLEIRPTSLVSATIVPTPNIGSITGDGATVTAINATSSLVAGTQVTVSSSLGTITTSDADAGIVGTQVVVGVGGAITFNLRSPHSSGTPTLDWVSADGAAHTTLTSATFLTFATPASRRFDFNQGFDANSMTPTPAGFIGVRTNHLSPATDGFGWLSQPPTAFQLPFNPIGVTLRDLFKDGVSGPTDSSAEFRVQALPATSYDVRVYVGTTGFTLDNVRVTVEGQAAVTAAATNWDQQTTVTVLGATDANADGYISITFADPRIGGALTTGWAVTGLDIVQQPTPLPAAALLTATIVADQSAAASITESELASVLAVAKEIVSQSDLSSDQRTRLAAVTASLSDLNALHALGLAGSREILIDDNGTGLGWSTDLRQVSVGKYDLLTVLAHELSHVLGQDHTDEGLLSPTLSPGVRATEIDAFFASDLGSLLSECSVAASPNL